MATTAIWLIKGRMDRVIAYVQNPEKTVNPEWDKNLERALKYAAASEKTAHQFYVSGVNCDPATARESMTLTKRQFGKTGGIVAFHGYQSFKPGEVFPDQAHAIGVELARRLWGDRFEVVVSTHLNTGVLHNHFLLNSVSFVDGKRYHDNKTTYAAMRRVSDELCRDRDRPGEWPQPALRRMDGGTRRRAHLAQRHPGGCGQGCGSEHDLERLPPISAGTGV